MSKIVKVGAIVFVVALIVALLGGAAVFAQDDAPAAPAAGNGTFSRGAGRGAAGGPHLGDEAHGLGLVDETAVHEAMAAALGMSVEDLDAALAEGKTLVVIAAEQGVDIGVVRDAMEAARADALQAAVAEGLITQEQADWMQNQGNHGAQAGGQGAGRAAGNGGMGGRGGRMGGNGMAGSGRAFGGYAGDCPLNQTP